MSKRVAMIISTIGYHWEEVYGAYDEFKKSGWETDLYTIDGKAPQPDPSSLKRTGLFSLFGLGVSKSNSPDTAVGQELMKRFNSVLPLSDLKPEQTDVLYLPGGYGCMFDMNRNEKIHAIIKELKKQDKVLSGVCHATSTFAFVEDGNESIVSGKKLTGCPKSLDQITESFGIVEKQFLPLPFSNEDILHQAGANLKWYNRLIAALNPRYVRTDWPFVTGVGPKAARGVARRIIRALEN